MEMDPFKNVFKEIYYMTMFNCSIDVRLDSQITTQKKTIALMDCILKKTRGPLKGINKIDPFNHEKILS